MSAVIQALAHEIKGRTDWAQILRERGNDPTLPTLSGRDIQKLLDVVQADFLRGKSANALAVSRVLAFLVPSLFIREARRTGLFRSSKVSFRCEPIAHVVRTLLQDGKAFPWASGDADYLQSVSNLLSLAPSARATRLYLITALYKRRKTILKSCMVIMDRAFRPAADHQPTEEQQMAEVTGQPHVFTREQKASAFSTIVVLMQEAHGIHEHAPSLIDETGIRDGTLTLPLLAALHRLPFMRTSCLAAGPRSSVAQTSWD